MSYTARHVRRRAIDRRLAERRYLAGEVSFYTYFRAILRHWTALDATR